MFIPNPNPPPAEYAPVFVDHTGTIEQIQYSTTLRRSAPHGKVVTAGYYLPSLRCFSFLLLSDSSVCADTCTVDNK